MKNIKEHFADYGYLSLLVVPVFFVISYLFNVIYFFAFGVSLSQVPLAVSDYITSINVLGIVLLFGIFWQIIAGIFGKYMSEKFPLIDRDSDTHFKTRMVKLDQDLERLNSSCDPIDERMKKLSELEEQSKKLKDDFEENAKKGSKKLIIFNRWFLVCALLSIMVFIYQAYSGGIFTAQVYFFLPMGGYFITHFFVRYDIFFVWLILTIVTCLAYSADSALRTALDNYKSDSVVITISGNKYFNMRSFENGFWVKETETGEVLFITKSSDILNFRAPKRIINHLSKES